MDRVELFSFEGCPYAQRTRMTLIEKGIDFELTEIDLFNRPEWFKEVSPYGKVPVLRHAGGTVYESGIINQYLDETFPDPPLMPQGALARAQARIWMDYCESRFLSTTHKLMTEAGDPDRRRENLAKFTEVLLFLETEALRKLSDGPYFFGEQVSLTDLQFSPFFERFGTYERMAGAVWPAECTRLKAWLNAMQTRASYRQTAKPTDYHIEQRRKMLDGLAKRASAASSQASSSNGRPRPN